MQFATIVPWFSALFIAPVLSPTIPPVNPTPVTDALFTILLISLVLYPITPPTFKFQPVLPVIVVFTSPLTSILFIIPALYPTNAPSYFVLPLDVTFTFSSIKFCAVPPFI